MGGHRGGEVASQLALETVEELFRRGRGHPRRPGPRGEPRGLRALGSRPRRHGHGHHAHRRPDRWRRGRTWRTWATPAPTCCAAGSLRQLTEDHTLVNRMVKAGEITRRGSRRPPAPQRPAPRARDRPRRRGRRARRRAAGRRPPPALQRRPDLGMVTEDQIQAILEAEPDPQEAADRLVRAANRAGGVDNITVRRPRLRSRTGRRGGGRRRCRPGREASARAVARAGIGSGVAGDRAAPCCDRRAGAASSLGSRLRSTTQWYVGVVERERRHLPRRAGAVLGLRPVAGGGGDRSLRRRGRSARAVHEPPEGINANRARTRRRSSRRCATDLAEQRERATGAAAVSAVAMSTALERHRGRRHRRRCC